MKVRDCTTSPALTCGLDDSLAEAAQIMWDADCGFAPVIDMASGKLVGVVTDRDACMAAMTQGQPLNAIPVSRAMNQDVVSVRPEDDLETALERMRSRQVRRLPVVDHQGNLTGVLSLNDVVLAAAEGRRADAARIQQKLLETMHAICRHRVPQMA